MKKRLTILMLVLVVIFSTVLAGCQAAAPTTPEEPVVETPADTPEEPATEEPATEETTEPEVVKSGKGELIVGSATEPSGDFATPWWQNNATDNAINTIMSGYSTYDMSPDAEIVLNDTAVKELKVTDNADGSRNYQYTINDGLVYSDGSPITAKDYVASILLFSSPQLVELGAKPTNGQFLVGYEEFNAGTSLVFAGVHLIDDMTFSVDLSSEWVPGFFETAFVSFGPDKLSYWLGTEDIIVKDDGEGVRWGLADEAADAAFLAAGETVAVEPETSEGETPAEETAPKFVQVWNGKDAEREAAINNARTDVNRPTSGAYKPKSWDQASKTTVIEINDKFLGNFEGQKPGIPTLIFKYADQATALDQFRTGAIDLLTGSASGTEINAGLDIVESDPDNFDYVEYDRSGYGKIAFVGDLYPTKDVEVRQAIAHLLDRNEFARAFTGGFGGVVNGPYGEGQWYYQESKAKLNEVLNSYPYSPEDAVALLVKAGWTLNADGGEYVEGEGLRHKMDEEGNLIPLEVKWLSSGNEVAEQLTIALVENPDVAKAGMKITEDIVDFDTLLNYLYRDASQDEKFGVPTYNMFNLGSGFPATYLPNDAFTTDPAKLALGYNTNYLIDQKLDDLATNLGKVDPQDREEFLKRYVDYITYWNELLPDLPLYSNIYHDFFNAKLQNYETNALIGLPVSLLYASVSE